MTEFKLKIVTPDMSVFDGISTFLKVRTVTGDVGIVGKHSDYFGMIEAAECQIEADSITKYAACADGFISILNGEVKIVATTFEWADEIDLERAKRAYEKTERLLGEIEKNNEDFLRLKEKLKRNHNRILVAEKLEKEAN